MSSDTVIQPPDNVTVVVTRPMVLDAYGRPHERRVGFAPTPASVQTGGQFPQLNTPRKPGGGKKRR